MEQINPEELKDYFHIEISLIGTKGALTNNNGEFEVYNKEELLERLEDILPEEEFGYSILSVTRPEDKGL